MPFGRRSGVIQNLKLRWVSWAVVTLVVIFFPKEVVGPHVCNANSINAFCLIPNQFKTIFDKAKTNVVSGDPPYQQFQKFVDLPNFGDVALTIDQKVSAPPPNSPKYFGSYNRFCELVYIKGNFEENKKGSPGTCGRDKENPYYIEVTEVEVNGQRMHNWLHITIKSDKTKRDAFSSGNGMVTGKILYAMLVVHNDISYAVGDFNNQLPCGHDCNCKPPKCYQAKAKDAIPCMYSKATVLTPPGQMMVYLGDASGNSEVEEIHATWRFAQYQHKDTFTTELHFKAYIVESEDIVQGKIISVPTQSEYYDYEGIHGWNPYYDILWPTIKTLGGWDYYRKYAYPESPSSEIKCHKPSKEGEYYITEKYSTIGNGDLPNDTMYKLIKFGLTGKSQSSAFLGARALDYSMLSQSKTTRLFYGYWNDTSDTGPESYNKKIGGKKIGSPYAKKDAARVPNFPNSKFPNVLTDLSQLTDINNKLFDIDRCGCPKFGTTQAPEDIPPPPIQVQGRKSHAVQMIIAWLCIVPFGMFIARYYKETYSKVFFLQEFWWFTIHVLCLLVAAMFMLGGIYAIEINRKDPIRWGDRNILAHVAVGSLAIFMFLVHLAVGHQRIKDVQKRLLQITLHWMFGFIEYILAISSMLLSAFILQGCLPCYAFYIISGWIGVQLIFYLLMEIHMRIVDKKLNLHPPRSYLPPPIMRVFHMNAPYSPFRVYMLMFYGILCVGVYGSVHVLIKYNDGGRSCFKYKD